MKIKGELYRENIENKHGCQVKVERIEDVSTEDVMIKKEDEGHKIPKQSTQIQEMLANIERKRKEREKKIEQIKAIPKSLADCIARSIVNKAKIQEHREIRAELKKIRAMEPSSIDKNVEIKKEKIPHKSSPASASLKWEVVNREPIMEQSRRSRSRSRNRRRTRSRPRTHREEYPSPSPPPPREWLPHKSKRVTRRRRVSPISSRSSS